MTDEINGVLIVDKKKGMTSHDVVDFLRKRFNIKKAGHAGTLDPGATGVLVLLLGKATKSSASFLNEEKEYTATMKLGEKTDTGDYEGRTIAKRDITFGEGDVRKVIGEFRGKIKQIPPMVSAKKIKGKRLYKLARKGVEVERTPNEVEIKKLQILKMDIPFVDIKVVCSKGTYVRQLADDIGERLGCGAHLTALRRTRSGKFLIENAVSLEKLGRIKEKDLYENLARL